MLYILIYKLGRNRACLISAVAFGIYHWFSYGVLGSPVQMFFVFMLTGTWGWMFAIAFARTKSMYLPIGLHMGWNAVNLLIFSQGNIGNQLLINVGGNDVVGFTSLGLFAIQWLLTPIVVFVVLKNATEQTESTY